MVEGAAPSATRPAVVRECAGPGRSPGYERRLPRLVGGVRTLGARVTVLLLSVVGAMPGAVYGQTPPERSLDAWGGRLVGRSNGEWGGSLHFEFGGRSAQRLLDTNVLALQKLGTSVVVFTGLAHVTSNEGAIYVVRRKGRHELSVSLLHRLAGEPSEIIRHKGGAVHFGVFTGKLVEEERPEGQSYVVTRKVLACKVLDAKLAIRSVPCTRRVP